MTQALGKYLSCFQEISTFFQGPGFLILKGFINHVEERTWRAFKEVATKFIGNNKYSITSQLSKTQRTGEF